MKDIKLKLFLILLIVFNIFSFLILYLIFYNLPIFR